MRDYDDSDADNDDEEDIRNELSKELIKRDMHLMSPKYLVELMNKHVVGQDNAKRVLAVGIYNHLKRIANTLYKERNPIQKSNILLIGPTGSGKTFLIESICKELEIPFGIADATSLTESGYWGEDVENVLLPLLNNCNMDTVLASRGIVYIDEIDKIAIDKEKGRDITGRGVQRSLLKILEGKLTRVITSSGMNSKQSPSVELDTTNILFIVGGAFSGLEQIIEKRSGTKEIGFSATHTKKSVNPVILSEDLIAYGFMPEFMGRLHNIARLNQLTLDDLVAILTEPENSIVKQYQSLFWHDTIDLQFESDALKLIAEYAIKQGTGVRGLKTIMEKAMLDIMFEAPNSDKSTLIVTKAMIKDRL